MQNTKTFHVVASPFAIEVSMRLGEGATRADAEAIVAEFPKAAGLRATTLSTSNFSELRAEGIDFRADEAEWQRRARNWTEGYIKGTYRVDRADGTTGDRNEAAERKLRSLAKNAAKLGYTFEYATPYTNSLSVDDPALAPLVDGGMLAV